MTYAELLQQYIKQSGKTLEQISKECAQKGVKIHPTYISKLRLGKRPAPSEEISRVLAEVTGGDPQRLIIKGYIEKIPDDLKDQLGLYKYLSNIDDIADEVTSKINELGGLDNAVEKIVRSVLAEAVFENPERFISELEKEEEIESVKKILEDIKNDPEYYVKSISDKALKKEEKMALALAVLPEVSILKPINIEYLRDVIKHGMLTNSEGYALPDCQTRPLLAHVEAIIEGLKKEESEKEEAEGGNHERARS
nr:MAG: hypothetical protein DIU66_08505 [Bacillota bacterium]